MLITVEVPDEVAARAAEAGEGPAAFVAGLVISALERSNSADERPDGRISIDEFRARVSRYPEHGISLPASALTREGIYEDHD